MPWRSRSLHGGEDLVEEAPSAELAEEAAEALEARGPVLRLLLKPPRIAGARASAFAAWASLMPSSRAMDWRPPIRARMSVILHSSSPVLLRAAGAQSGSSFGTLPPFSAIFARTVL